MHQRRKSERAIVERIPEGGEGDGIEHPVYPSFQFPVQTAIASIDKLFNFGC